MDNTYGTALERWLSEQTGTDMPRRPVVVPAVQGVRPSATARGLPAAPAPVVAPQRPGVSPRGRRPEILDTGYEPPAKEEESGSIFGGFFDNIGKFGQVITDPSMLYKPMWAMDELYGGKKGTPPPQQSEPEQVLPEGPLPPDRPMPAGPLPPESAPPAQAQQEPGPVTLDDYMKFVKSYFPAAPQMPAAPSDDSKMWERQRLLAQLAFAGGLTAAGGGSWKQVGQGFTDAASTYDKGFDRYQKALNDSADRAFDQTKLNYTTDLAQREAALKLYTDARSDARTRAEKRYDALIARLNGTYDDLMKEASKGDDMGVVDPKRISNIEEARIAALQQGRFVNPYEIEDLE